MRIFIDGLLRNEFRRALNRNDMWAVARIDWAADGNATVSPAAADSSNVIGTVRQLNYLPGPDGFDFGPAFP